MAPTILLEIGDIERMTHIPAQKLRYVSNEPLLPEMEQQIQADTKRGRGRARRFSLMQAFHLSLSALMLQAGLARPAARAALEMLLTRAAPAWAQNKGQMLQQFTVFRSARAVTLEVADGAYLRVEVQGRGSRLPLRKFGWTSLETGQPAPSQYQPLATVRIDLARLAERLGAGQ